MLSKTTAQSILLPDIYFFFCIYEYIVHIWVDISVYMYVHVHLCVCVCICVYACGFSMQMSI